MNQHFADANDAVSVVGLGYVGSVVAASLATDGGRRVIGVDRRPELLATLGEGVAPIPEPGLAERLSQARMRQRISFTDDLAAATRASSLSLVCVGTPVNEAGELDESDVLDVCASIARSVAPGRGHVIVVRCTVGSGHYRRAQRVIEANRHPDARVSLALNPEFLREGSALGDHENPELVVYATTSEEAATAVERLYTQQKDRLARTDPETAEVLKLVNNAWHALKVSFANEVARVTRPVGVDPFAVMELLCRDRKLNISPAYLRPGMPFGGACLTKDVASLSTHAAKHEVEAPLMSSILESNRAHLDFLVAAVKERNPKHVAIVGLGFKPGASDVRDSAPVRLVHRLLDEGIHVTVADQGILESTVPPLGLDALRHALGDPRANAAQGVAEAADQADLIVVGHPDPHDRAALVNLRPNVPILDSAGELSRHLTHAERRALDPVVVLARTAIAR